MANMLKLILKNFVSKPATRPYPAVEREPFERTRGRIFFDDSNCIYCGICSKKCPADAITVDRGKTTWKLNTFRCIVCGECVNSCPKKCIKMTNERRTVAESKKIITITKHLEVAADADKKEEVKKIL